MTDNTGNSLLKERIDSVLEEFVTAEAHALADIDAALQPVSEQLHAATGHGKRLRAAFCYWGWRGTGQPDSDALVRAAAAIELVHAAAVVHDDLIDHSSTRHGRPTVHTALSRPACGQVRDADRGPSGRDRPQPSARALAMLVGDLLMAMAGQLFTSSGLPGAFLHRARPLWTVLARELVAGECLEILRTGRDPELDASVKVIRYKTAKYTVEHPLQLGGLLAGATPRLLQAYSDYGLPLGEAFQLRDDLLGLFGDPAETGKDPADDVTGDRPTVLMAHALGCAGPAEREELRGLLGQEGLTEQQVQQVRDIACRTGAVTRVEEMITARQRAAQDALAGADVTGEARRALTTLAADATTRTH
ncbi:polyprenyl synthetase family protein [Streptomyces sp. NPDC001691]|uniref:polyprenyl synthetase family protein n=1 Tax=unclassified Streptomyces TaxID=2593676 RepID=UPI000DE81367|nr:polyprenyl synthetase family protein [Streptomyces sp. SDr-06]RCH64002.1 polyprenyl synthetase family protein [Streptomyces sp. SDr-06]